MRGTARPGPRRGTAPGRRPVARPSCRWDRRRPEAAGSRRARARRSSAAAPPLARRGPRRRARAPPATPVRHAAAGGATPGSWPVRGYRREAASTCSAPGGGELLAAPGGAAARVGPPLTGPASTFAHLGWNHSTGTLKRGTTAAETKRRLPSVGGPHRGVEAVGGDQLDGFGGDDDRLVEQLPFPFAEAAEDVVGAPLLRGRLADPDPHPEVAVRLQVLRDRAQAVVAGEP